MTTTATVHAEMLATEDYVTFDRATLESRYSEALPENAVTFTSVDHARRFVISTGSHFYDADAIRYFRAHSDTHLFGGRFWVESKQYEDSMTGERDARVYQVAWVSPAPGMASVERVGEYDTLDKARRAARRLAETIV